MKEAYLQEKIREFNYKIKQQMDLAEQLNQELQRLQLELKQHKHLIKQLKAFESFKESTIRDIKHETQKTLKTTLDKTQKDLQKELHATLTTYLKKHQSQQIPDLTPEIQKHQQKLDELTKATHYSEHLLELLLDQLVTDRVLAQDQVEIIKKRAKIRGKK